GVERVGVVVDVGDFLPGEFDDDVAAFEAGLFRRAAGAHAGQLHASHFGRVIRNGAQVGAQSVAPPAAALDLHVVGSRRVFHQVQHQAAGEAGDAVQPVVVQLVRSVGGTVIIVVAAGEETQDRNLFGVQRGGVRRQIGVVLQRQIKAGGDIALLDQMPPVRGRADA